MKRTGKRGKGKWERTTWDEMLDTFATKIRAAIIEDRRDEVMYHPHNLAPTLILHKSSIPIEVPH